MENLNVGVRVEHPEERVVAEGYGPVSTLPAVLR